MTHLLILGDCPSPPGMPVIQQLRRDVYQVIWDPSRENGAHVELYCLKGKTEGGKREKREANFTLDTDSSTRIEDNNAVEVDDDSDSWVLYYNGTGMRYQYGHCACIRLTLTFFVTVKSLRDLLFIYSRPDCHISVAFGTCSSKSVLYKYLICHTANVIGNILF
jgi:hypothetical protein